MVVGLGSVVTVDDSWFVSAEESWVEVIDDNDVWLVVANDEEEPCMMDPAVVLP